MLRKALLIFRLVFLERSAYRVNFCLEIAGGILSILIVVCLWLAVYRSPKATRFKLTIFPLEGDPVSGGYPLMERKGKPLALEPKEEMTQKWPVFAKELPKGFALVVKVSRRIKEAIMNRPFIRVIVGLAILGSFFLTPAVEEAAAQRKYLSLGTGNPGGTFYFIGAGFANLFNKKVPGVRVIAESTAASEENFHYVLRKKMDMGLISIHVIDPALEKKMDLSGVRLVCLGHTSDRHWFVRKDSPIKSIPDFKGKRVALGSPGSGTLVSSKMELGAAGKLGLEDFKPAYLSFTESITAIKDGTVDVGVISAGYPVASLLDLARTVPIRLILYAEQELKAIMDAHPFYVRVVIPAGTYQGIDTDTLTRGIVTAIFCRQEMSDDLNYQMMKALYDNPKEKDAIHPQARQWNLENMFRGAEYTTKYIPFHSGAVKYLKEKGAWKQMK